MAMRQEIRFGGSNDDLVWRSPIEDFNTGSAVIVDESQVAVFYMNGQCSEVLEPGLTVLETCELPFIRRVVQLATLSRTPFRAQLYYVNRVELAKLKWGVGNITYKDIKGPVFEIGARGLYALQAENPRRLIEKLNGVQGGYDRESLEERFRELIASVVSDTLVNAFYDNKISIIDAARYRVKIGDTVRSAIEEMFAGYGLSVTQFIIERFAVPTEEKSYRDLVALESAEGLQKRQLDLEVQRELTRAEIEAGKVDIHSSAVARMRQREGFTYQHERQFDVLDTAARNESGGGGGNLAAQFVQLGVGLGAAGSVGGMVRESLQGTLGAVGASPPVPGAPCARCSASLPSDAKFCPSCGEKVVPLGSMTCRGCQRVVAKGKFCPECGMSQEGSTP